MNSSSIPARGRLVVIGVVLLVAPAVLLAVTLLVLILGRNILLSDLSTMRIVELYVTKLVLFALLGVLLYRFVEQQSNVNSRPFWTTWSPCARPSARTTATSRAGRARAATVEECDPTPAKRLSLGVSNQRTDDGPRNESRTPSPSVERESRMKSYERKQLLARIDREGATIGTSIPEEITVEGESLELRAFVFEARSHESVPAEDREEIEAAKRNLRRERIDRRDRIEEGDISKERGEELAESIVGIDRALHALSDLGTSSVEAEAEAQEHADRKRWVSFLQQALGKDSGRSAGGRR